MISQLDDTRMPDFADSENTADSPDTRISDGVAVFATATRGGRAEPKPDSPRARRQMTKRGDTLPHKRCPRCGQSKTTLDFALNASCKDGLQNWCRRCKSAYDRLRPKI